MALGGADHSSVRTENTYCRGVILKGPLNILQMKHSKTEKSLVELLRQLGRWYVLRLGTTQMTQKGKCRTKAIIKDTNVVTLALI